ncbi:hypothetical protein FI667_g13139, partial [Globisporangium splendens]
MLSADVVSAGEAHAMEWDSIDLWIDTVCRDEDQDMLFEISSPSSPSFFSDAQTRNKDEDPLAVCFVEEPLLMELDEVITWNDDNTTSDKMAPADLNEESVTIQLGNVVVVSTDAIPSQDARAEDLRHQPPPQSESNKPTRSLRSSLTRAAKAVVVKATTISATPATRMKRSRKVQQRERPAKGDLRKSRQRSYEQKYRGRLRDQRCEDEHKWLAYEAQFRELLTHKTVLIQESREKNSMLSKYVNELHEYRSLQGERAYLMCVEKWRQALDIWGVETKASCEVRYQINALPQPQLYPVFSGFTW